MDTLLSQAARVEEPCLDASEALGGVLNRTISLKQRVRWPWISLQNRF